MPLKFDLINLPQDFRRSQELIEEIADRSVDPIVSYVRQRSLE